MLAAAQFGQHNVKRQSFGHALAVDPWGKVLADAGGHGKTEGPHGENQGIRREDALVAPSIITCEIDLNLIQAVRQRIPIGVHRQVAEMGS